MINISAKAMLSLALSTSALLSTNAMACGPDSYMGTICAFGFNFCPVNTLPADGRLQNINQNTALFALLGTTYGGDGRTTFALPDLRGRTLVGVGTGPGFNPVIQGQKGGAQQVTLTASQMPIHTHSATTAVDVSTRVNAVSSAGNSSSPSGNALAASSTRDNLYSNAAPNATLAGNALTTVAGAITTIANAGGSQPVATQSPFLGINYCIVTEGIFPSRP